MQMELQAGIGHIVAVHEDTKPGVFKNVPFGEGVVDFGTLLRNSSKQSGYCGPYLIEMWSETAEDPAAEVAKGSVDWVKARMAKSGHGGGGIMQS